MLGVRDGGIGADTSERLDVIPAQFRVVVTERPKFACRACAGVVAPGPVVVEFSWSHAQRQYYDPALKPKAPISEEALRCIAAPNPIAAEILGTPPEQRMAKRRSPSRSLVEELFAWFDVPLGAPKANFAFCRRREAKGLLFF